KLVKLTRQSAGNINVTYQCISRISGSPIASHAAMAACGDVSYGSRLPTLSCAGMDLLGANSSRTNDLLTITLTLNAAPSSAKAIACGTGDVTGGIWGAEFWAAASGADGGADGGNTFYLAYRDNPPDGTPAVEAGRVDATNLT